MITGYEYEGNFVRPQWSGERGGREAVVTLKWRLEKKRDMRSPGRAFEQEESPHALVLRVDWVWHVLGLFEDPCARGPAYEAIRDKAENRPGPLMQCLRNHWNVSGGFLSTKMWLNEWIQINTSGCSKHSCWAPWQSFSNNTSLFWRHPPSL